MPISLLCSACYCGLLYTYPTHVTPIVHSLHVSDTLGPRGGASCSERLHSLEIPRRREKNIFNLRSPHVS